MMNNMGSLDRMIRLALAAFMAILFFTHTVTGTLGIILLTFAGILLLTSIVGACPLYLPLGLSSKRNKI